jgi:hypothetical protein
VQVFWGKPTGCCGERSERIQCKQSTIWVVWVLELGVVSRRDPYSVSVIPGGTKCIRAVRRSLKNRMATVAIRVASGPRTPAQRHGS